MSKAWYEANKEEVAAYAAGYYAEHRSEILAQKAKWRAENKAEAAARDAKYYADHKDKDTYKAAKKIYLAKWRPEHKAEAAAYAEGYYAAHKDFLADQHSEYYNVHKAEIAAKKAVYRHEHKAEEAAWCAIWRANNPDKVQAGHSRRRARKMGAESDNSVLSDIITLYGNRCLCCGAETALTVDHIVPLARGGSDLIDNKQPLCKSCNSRKGAKTVDYRITIRFEAQ